MFFDFLIPMTDKEVPPHIILRSSGSGPLFVFHHGAGLSAASFSLLQSAMLDLLPCTTLSFDCRGHGMNISDLDSNNSVLDLSLETLANDLRDIIQQYQTANQQVILIGHSMGGAVVVHLMHKRLVKNVIGCVVLDVVEGSAIESLAHMNKILASRPNSFPSIENAIDWSIRNHQIMNRKSAEISIPTQLKLADNKYVWKTDLSKSSPYWQEWFLGLSDKFLSMPCAKLLVLAGTDRLDKPLTIGQMQGKFQMVVIPESGHYIQEDVPEKLSQVLHEFYQRNQPLDISKIKKFPIPANVK
ncbi:Alpha/Beta hydrolase protein [Globomyces pollinis-pini]|nr:Alpha/Beta hydrolase protein [Globomyces pollinis-pini]